MIIGFSRNIEILKTSSSVEGDLLCLDLSVFDINFVTNQTDGDSFADSGQVLVPFGDVLVGDSGAHIEHDDSALPTNVVPFTKSSKFLLSSSVPNVELDWTVVGVENNGIHIDSSGCY